MQLYLNLVLLVQDRENHNDQQMAGADGKAIPEGNDACRSDGVPKEDPLAIDWTERAEHRWERANSGGLD